MKGTRQPTPNINTGGAKNANHETANIDDDQTRWTDDSTAQPVPFSHPLIMRRTSPRLAAARERLPFTRQVWNSEDLHPHIAAVMDWPTLMAVARVDRCGLHMARKESAVRVEVVLRRHFHGPTLDLFVQTMASTRAAIVGGVSLHLLRINHASLEYEMKDCVAHNKTHGLLKTDLNILVPEATFEECKRFIMNNGFPFCWDMGIGTCYRKEGVTQFAGFAVMDTSVRM